MSLPFDPKKDLGVVVSVLVEGHEPAPGSVKRTCQGCKRQVWLSGPALELADREELPIMCIQCAHDFVTKDQPK
jgi:hypothetical protein